MSPRKRKLIIDNDSGQSSSSVVPTIGCQTTRQFAKRAAMLRAISAQSVDVSLPSSSSITSVSISPRPLYMDLGNCSCFCKYCHVAFWFEERLKSSPQKYDLDIIHVAKQGLCDFIIQKIPPMAIKDLYGNSHFMSNIHAYNSMFSMTSFGADIDDDIYRTTGPYVFKVAGQISHWIGPLCPLDANPRFLQMYIFDTENEMANILCFFQDGNGTQLYADIVAALTHVHAEVNEYVMLFKSAIELCTTEPVLEFAIALYNNTEQNHAVPGANCLGAIICDDDPLANGYDIVIHSKEGVPRRVSKLHSSYMPFQL